MWTTWAHGAEVASGSAAIWALACGGFDSATRRIPNILTLSGHAAALIALAAAGRGWLGASVADCFVAWCLSLLLTLPGYAFRLLGAGDVKLLAAMGLLGGMEIMLGAYVVAGLLAGGVALVWLFYRHFGVFIAVPLARIGIDLPMAAEPKGRMLPFGSMLAAGFIVGVVGMHYGGPEWYKAL